MQPSNVIHGTTEFFVSFGEVQFSSIYRCENRCSEPFALLFAC